MMRETPAIANRVLKHDPPGAYRRANGFSKAEATVKVRGRVVTPDRLEPNCIVEISGDRITKVRPAEPADPVDWTAAYVLPGFIDIHVHGGGGHTFTTGDPAQARSVAAFHLRHGTTTMLASLVTSPPELLRQAVRAYAPLVQESVIAGIHLEGPYLSPARRGAQNPDFLRAPDPDEIMTVLDGGGVRMMTVAPELPGALAAIALLREYGVVVAAGHTDATHEQTRAAVAAGVSVATHLFNGMRPVHHREPGPVIALLDAPGVVCEVIADGVHLHDEMLAHVVRSAGPDRVALITDAIAAAGMGDGAYDLGGKAVRVRDGVARLVSDESLAGSTLTMDAALRRTVQSGASLVDAARMAATTPARVLGLDGDRGTIAPGMRADLVLLDEQLTVVAVIRSGQIAD